MKKASLFLLAGGILTFASCKEENMTTGGMTQQQVDSAIQSRVNMALDSMAMATEAQINDMAMFMADSMMKAQKGITVTTPRPSTITRNPRPTTPPPAPNPTTNNNGGVQQGGFGSKSDQNQGNNKGGVQGGGFGSKSDQNQGNNKSGVQGGGFKNKSDQSQQPQK